MSCTVCLARVRTKTVEALAGLKVESDASCVSGHSLGNGPAQAGISNSSMDVLVDAHGAQTRRYTRHLNHLPSHADVSVHGSSRACGVGRTTPSKGHNRTQTSVETNTHAIIACAEDNVVIPADSFDSALMRRDYKQDDLTILPTLSSDPLFYGKSLDHA